MREIAAARGRVGVFDIVTARPRRRGQAERHERGCPLSINEYALFSWIHMRKSVFRGGCTERRQLVLRRTVKAGVRRFGRAVLPLPAPLQGVRRLPSELVGDGACPRQEVGMNAARRWLQLPGGRWWSCRHEHLCHEGTGRGGKRSAQLCADGKT
eukprot:356703-Chlamydomonas_euryale.AAC.3